MNPVDLAFMPALEQAQQIRRGELSPLELTQLYLERIQRLNPTLGSYFTVTAEQSLQEARRKTEQLSQSTAGLDPDLPPFFGVPIAIKDLNPVEGIRCTYGSQALLQNIASHDDATVSRIKQAGFTILGKTATPEVGTLPYTEPEGFPAARNPWHLDYTPGGSSGGSAAALAAGLCAIAQGSDGGGSIRGPAYCCGVVGIKPSRGRISHAPIGDHQSGIATNGPLGHTVADAAALLDVMSGYVTGDPYWLPDPEIPFLETARRAAPPSLRVAFSTKLPPIGEADATGQQAVLETAKQLEALGHQIEPCEIDCEELIKPFTVVWQSGVGASGIPAEALGKMNRWLLAQPVSSGDYLRAVGAMQAIARRIVASFEPYDVMVLPVYLHPAIRIGEWANLSPEETLQKIIEWIAPCPPFNASGQPAIALPTGFTETGIPVGVQLVGRPAAEATLIAVAAQLEAANPWIHHRPAIALEV